MHSFVQSYYSFFSANLTIIYFVYGLVFFLMGFAILIQNRSRSKIKLANALKYLAVFGIMLGLSEWAVIFYFYFYLEHNTWKIGS